MIGWILLGLVCALAVYSICKYVEYLNKRKLEQLVREAESELIQNNVFSYFEKYIAKVEEVGVTQVKVKFYVDGDYKAYMDVNTNHVASDIHERDTICA